MDKVAHFYKEPFSIFKKHFEEFLAYKTSISSKTKWSEKEIREIYEKIELPEKLEDSNIYVFSYPMEINLRPNDIKIFPLGICCEIIEQDYIFIMKRYINNNQIINPLEVSIFTPTEFIRYGQENHNIILRIENKYQKEVILENNTKIAIGLFLKTGTSF